MTAVNLLNSFISAGGGTHRYWIVRLLGGYDRTYSIAEIEFAATVGGADLTAPGTAIHAGITAANDAFDNNTSTNTSTFTSNMDLNWIGWDFGAGAPATVREVRLTASATLPNQMPQVFAVLGSEDQVTWLNYGVFTSGTWTAGQQRAFALSLVPVTGKVGWRVNISTLQSGTLCSIAEVKFLPACSVSCTGGGGFASSQFSTGYSGGEQTSHAFDGNGGTRWTGASGLPVRIGYAFTSDPGTITSLDLTSFTGVASRMPTDFTIESTNDFMNWTTERTVTGSTGWTAPLTRNYTIP